jgi:hypothetical protein
MYGSRRVERLSIRLDFHYQLDKQQSSQPHHILDQYWIACLPVINFSEFQRPLLCTYRSSRKNILLLSYVASGLA